jgi:hypothetical protein
MCCAGSKNTYFVNFFEYPLLTKRHLHKGVRYVRQLIFVLNRLGLITLTLKQLPLFWTGSVKGSEGWPCVTALFMYP